MPSVPKLQPAQVSSASAAAAAEAAKGQIRQANESLILEAAERVFAGAGFSGATMAAIAEASGLPKANLHYYFGNKQDLYRAVLARTLSDWLAPTHGITPEADPAVALGRMAPVNTVHLFFTIWSATQTYADFEVQIASVLGRSALTPKDYAQATEHVVGLILRGCGLAT